MVDWEELDLSAKGHKGKGVWTEVEVKEGEIVTFVVSGRLFFVREEEREGGRRGELTRVWFRFESSFDNFPKEASRGTLPPKERNLPRRLLSRLELIFRLSLEG